MRALHIVRHPFLRRAIGGALVLVVLWMLWPQVFGGRVSYVMVSGTSMEPGMHSGDLVLVRSQPRYRVGDAVAFRVPKGEPGAGHVVIHRLIERSPNGEFGTQGDNRGFVDPWRPTDDDIVGSRWVLVPGAGILLALLRSPIALGTVCGLLTMWVLMPRRKVKAAVEVKAAEAAS